ncbi:MAG: ribbon-helix-helix domain-containing protein [Thermoprotei archaeon]|nr:ribbon-helix-helix domain-containing protein [Thermoprotei archaeon]
MFEEKIEKLKSKIEDAYGEAVRELEELVEETIYWRGPFKFKYLAKKLEDIVEDFGEDLLEVKRSLRDLRREAERAGDKSLSQAVDDVEKLIESRVEEFTRKYEDVIRKIEDQVPVMRFMRVKRDPYWTAITVMPQRLARIVGKEVGEALKSALEEVRRAAESVSAATVVSSIRLREEDARVVDELVDAGIFKSRSEAVAFFVRKGIEASKEWLEKVRENIKKIRELQEEVKKELGEER